MYRSNSISEKYKVLESISYNIIHLAHSNMKALVLDSAPTIPINAPDDAPLLYQARSRSSKGYPFLGAQQPVYSHFVTLGEGSPRVKKLMEIPETDVSPPQTVNTVSELLKAEKISNMKEESSTSSSNINDSQFKEAAHRNLEAADALPENSYKPSTDAPKVTGKNTAAFVNEMAAVAATKQRKVVKKALKQTTKKTASKGGKKVSCKRPSMPKKASKPQKMNSFRIMGKKK